MPRTWLSLNWQAVCAPRALAVCVLAALLMLSAPAAAAENEKPKVTEVPEAVVAKFKLDTTFYKKHLDYKGFSILSSAKVSDQALLEAFAT